VPVTDLFMMDLKVLPEEKHRDATGRSNSRILENARSLVRRGVPIIFRTPVVPTVNDSDEEIERIAGFIRQLADERMADGHASGIRYELLPFHALAADKYRSLGLDFPAEALTTPSRQTMEHLQHLAQRHGIPVSIP
jgi:pyruvate formate lyase activating enzyme